MDFCLSDNVEEAQKLAKTVPDINFPDFEENPLILAVERGQEGICAALLKAGANPFHHNQYGQTAMEIAEEKQLFNLQNLLLEYAELHKTNGIA